tara:strand:- start:204 stop:437 length:234 start_codon:yes stop_codon:yes gene_type:complete
MIVPNRTVKPVDSLLTIGAVIIELLIEGESNVEDLYKSHIMKYEKKIDIEKFLLALNFLFVIGKIEYSDEVIKLKFN